MESAGGVSSPVGGSPGSGSPGRGSLGAGSGTGGEPSALSGSTGVTGRPAPRVEPEAAEAPELPVLPGFREMALRRMAEERAGLVSELAAQRQAIGLSQTEIAARMGTSQSAVARLESGTTDVRASTLERYAAAVGGRITWKLDG